jgi:hypothetical protein
MFLPNRSVQQEKEQRARYYKRVEELTQQRFASQEMNDACCISVQEVVCGDPACSPVDTVVSLTFDSYVLLYMIMLYSTMMLYHHRRRQGKRRMTLMMQCTMQAMRRKSVHSISMHFSTSSQHQ